jgi:hypothetical protein
LNQNEYIIPVVSFSFRSLYAGLLFFPKDKQIIVLERTDVNNASQLLEQGFKAI